ncbi:MAG: hypothetical protein O7G84_00905 [Gammaproteobacteria bacterium]|nr:hypothetical protein [Gammaproteobacteria bacterium]
MREEIDVDAALSRHRERLKSQMEVGRRMMSECRCPDDGSALIPSHYDGGLNVVTVRCMRCRFWMRIFEQEEHRPWMRAAWDTLHESQAVQEWQEEISK